MKKENPIKLTVEKLINGGYGLCREDTGRIILAGGVIPGEQIEIHQVKKKKGTFWSGQHELITRSPDRQERCPNAATCGGCQLIFMSESREQQEKQNMFQDICSRAGIHMDQPPQLHTFAFEESRFRGTIHFNNGQAGFFSQKSHHISSITGCRVLPDIMMGIYQLIDTFAAKHKTLHGEVIFSVSPDQKQVILGIYFPLVIPATVRELLADTLEAVPEVKGATLLIGTRKTTLFGSPKLSTTWNRHFVRLDPASFFQSNPHSWQTFWSLVSRWSKNILAQDQWIWDMHAGSGFLASAVKEHSILATEPDSKAQSNLKTLVKGNGRTLHCRAEDAINKLPDIDLGGLILDPPRGGLCKKIRQWITKFGPDSIIFFSCEWSTLVRDIAGLLESYAIEEPVHLLDVSPGTFRMETAVILKRTKPRQNKMSS